MKKIPFFLIIIIINLIKVEIFHNTIYNLILNDKYLSYYNKKIVIINSSKYSKKSNFRITKCQKSLYNIEHVESNLILTVEKSKLKLIPKLKNEKSNTRWFILEINYNNYIIKNLNKCYIYYKNNKLKCDKNKKNEASIFSLIKIYEELNHSKNDLKLIEKEPIDVVIKYIDLRDPELKREGIPQIKKDEDNQEIKYSIRSILKNIPWVRKIYIILPNKKVRYFKDYKLIKNKIVYINDKDLLGFDSSNIYTFHFHFWKLKKYNVSNNIISMDDDYFIGKPLKKSDFFYVENGKVVPAIITPSFKEEMKDKLLINLNNLKKKAKEAKEMQNDKVYYYTIANTLFFILRLLKREKLIVPKFNHNALPCNLKDIKEMYDLVYKSEFKTSTLDSIYRGIETLQFQTFYITYKFNINNNTKVNRISYAYIDHNKAIFANYNYSLFVLNTGGLNYTSISFKKARLAMEKIFPEPTPYEIVNNSYFPSFAFNIVYELDKEIEELKLNGINKSKIILILFDKSNNLLFLLIIFKIMINYIYLL